MRRVTARLVHWYWSFFLRSVSLYVAVIPLIRLLSAGEVCIGTRSTNLIIIYCGLNKLTALDDFAPTNGSSVIESSTCCQFNVPYTVQRMLSNKIE